MEDAMLDPDGLNVWSDQRLVGQVYTWIAHERPRLSLAGAQDKCPVLLKDDDYWLPRKESSSL